MAAEISLKRGCISSILDVIVMLRVLVINSTCKKVKRNSDNILPYIN